MIKTNELQQLINQQIPFEFYQYGEDESFYVGYLKAFDDDYILIKQMDINGILYGYDLFKLNETSQISLDSDYLDAIINMKEIANHHIKIDLVSDFKVSKNNLLESVLSYLKASQNVFEYQLIDDEEDTMAFGILNAINGDELEIEEFQFPKEPIKSSLKVDVDNLEAISFDEIDHLLLTKFNEKN